jgi:hypothetical protein
MKQNEQILTALLQGKKLTTYTGFLEFGCTKLGTRIHEFRKLGFTIHDKRSTKNGKSFLTWFM